ncbi:MAG TPA: DUF711 family protein [Ktedonobacterales bacterium]|nr:DUF711 family protein [Ktedonobacterales bacterium]
MQPLDNTIRTITLGVAAPHPLRGETLARAATFLRAAQTAAELAGYVVQTTRLATRPLLEDMADVDDATLIAYARDLQAMCDDLGLGFLSLGPAPADDPAFPLERLRVIPPLLAPNPTLNISAQLASAAHPPHFEGAWATAQVMRGLRLASATADNDTNFRFAALAMCEPGGPFFPQAYHRAPEWTVAVGMQTAGLVGAAIADALATTENPAELEARRALGALTTLPRIGAAVSAALARAATPVVALVRAQASDAGFAFGGIDLSPAPMGAESIVAALEQALPGPFGAPGTLALVAMLTAAIKGAAQLTAHTGGESLPTCGYNGLMLPVLEDETLGLRCAEGRLTVQELLTYSAICGTGLDTIPLPGDTPVERVAGLLLDVATLAHRLRKPLSARLLFAANTQAGEMTQFASPYLTNTRVMALP